MKQILLKNTGWKCAAVISPLLLILASLLVEVEVYASKPGMEVCSNCHTMHNSQDGQSMRLDSTSIIGAGAGECLDCHAQNRAVLLRMDCIGCHTLDLVNTPQVAHNNIDDLAAGNFRYVFEWNDRKGHNVHGFGALVNAGDLGNFPPGYNRAFDPSSIGYDQYNPRAQMMCAGANGCHGNRSELSQMDAMKGAHHSIDNMLKAGLTFDETAQVTDGPAGEWNKVGSSYRMLLGVRGIESADWEANPSPANHNEYKGEVFTTRTIQSYSGANAISTISDFCASCHGNFHMTGTDGIGGPGSPWLRHPVDILLPATPGSEYLNYTTYSLTAPVARLNLAGSVGANVQGNAVVMCLSCHRAHASPNDKILRWNYKSIDIEVAISGCAVCHTSMN